MPGPELGICASMIKFNKPNTSSIALEHMAYLKKEEQQILLVKSIQKYETLIWQIWNYVSSMAIP